MTVKDLEWRLKTTGALTEPSGDPSRPVWELARHKKVNVLSFCMWEGYGKGERTWLRFETFITPLSGIYSERTDMAGRS